MKKNLKFTLITSWILFSRGFDAYCTYQYTPDLSNEANPLVSVFNFTWTPLLLVVFGLSIIVIYTFYKTLYKSFDLHPKESGFSFSHFVGYVYSGKKQSWLSMFYSLPNSLKRLAYYNGEVITMCLAFAGVISTLMWFGINYIPIYKTIHSAPLIYSLIMLGSLFIIYWWNYKEYKYYQLKHATNNRNRTISS